MDEIQPTDHTQLRKMYETARKVNQERYALGSKKRLISNIGKKFKTAMIGTIARCEEQLGFLWGHGLDPEQITEDQRKFKEEVWDVLRTEILNHCNSQLRAATEEMQQYQISWNQYKIDFIVKKDI